MFFTNFTNFYKFLININNPINIKNIVRDITEQKSNISKKEIIAINAGKVTKNFY